MKPAFPWIALVATVIVLGGSIFLENQDASKLVFGIGCFLLGFLVAIAITVYSKE